MMRNLVRKELLDHFYSFRFAVSSVIVLFIMILSVMVLRQDFLSVKAGYTESANAYWKDVEKKDSYMTLMFTGIGADRPPAKMQMLYLGMERNPNRHTTIFPFFKPFFQGELHVNPVFPLFPAVDLVFVISLVLSLLAFVYSYDAVSGERERGTLKLLMSYSVSRDRVILAKWIGGYISLIIPYMLGMLICAIILLATPQTGFTGQDWGAFVVTVGIGLLFIAVMYSVGLFVSVVTRRSATSISLLLLLWVLFVLVIPNAAPYVADQVYRIDSISTLISRIKSKSGNTISTLLEDQISAMEDATGLKAEQVDFRAGRNDNQQQQQQQEEKQTSQGQGEERKQETAQAPAGVDMSMVQGVIGEITDDDLREIQLKGCRDFISAKLKEKMGMDLDSILKQYPEASKVIDECEKRKDELIALKNQALAGGAPKAAAKTAAAAAQPKPRAKISMNDVATRFLASPEENKARFYDRFFKSFIDLNKINSKATKDEMEAYQRKVDTQVTITKNISRLSPVASFLYATTDMAGTGIEHERHLQNYMWKYQSAFQEFLEKKFNEPDSKRTHKLFGGFFREPEYKVDDMPRFKYVEMALADRIGAALTDVFVLVAFAVIFFMAAFVSFLRADIIE